MTVFVTMQLFVVKKRFYQPPEIGFTIHRTKSLPTLIIILGCPKLTWYLLTLEDDLHQLHAYLSIPKSNLQQNEDRYLGHDKVNGQILEYNVETSSIWNYSEEGKGLFNSLANIYA